MRAATAGETKRTTPSLSLDGVDQPRVRDGDRGLIGERRDERDVFVGEWPGRSGRPRSLRSAPRQG
jgi:hypothetical protein